jgi:hypothetical protein
VWRVASVEYFSGYGLRRERTLIAPGNRLEVCAETDANNDARLRVLECGGGYAIDARADDADLVAVFIDVSHMLQCPLRRSRVASRRRTLRSREVKVHVDFRALVEKAAGFVSAAEHAPPGLALLCCRWHFANPLFQSSVAVGVAVKHPARESKKFVFVKILRRSSKSICHGSVPELAHAL